MFDPTSSLLQHTKKPGDLPQPEAKARFAEERLLDAVVWCDLVPGEIVTEADVMQRFGLTRAAARAALTRLGFEDWAQPLARLGWKVLPISGALIGQVLTARRIAEPALGRVELSHDRLHEVARLGAIADALAPQPEPGAAIAFRHFAEQIDNLLLEGIDRFTARHLRKLWRHSARITRFLEDEGSAQSFQRRDIPALVRAVVARDEAGIVATRHALIDAQEAYFLRRMLKSNAALGPGSGFGRRITEDTAATHRRHA